MRVINMHRAGLATVLLAGMMGTAFAAPASASTTPPAPTATGTCRITVTNTDDVLGDEVQALRLQERSGDEIFMRLNGQRFPASTTDTVSFTFAGEGRPASAFENPTKVYIGSVQVELLEKDFLGIGNDPIGNVFLGCAPFRGTLQLIGAGAAYNVEIVIQPV